MHSVCGDSCKINSCLIVGILVNMLENNLGIDIFSIFIKYLICKKCHTFLLDNKFPNCVCRPLNICIVL